MKTWKHRREGEEMQGKGLNGVVGKQPRGEGGLLRVPLVGNYSNDDGIESRQR
jgi:hypothetical protein